MEPPHTYLSVGDEGFDQKVLEEASGLANLQRLREIKLRPEGMSCSQGRRKDHPLVPPPRPPVRGRAQALLPRHLPERDLSRNQGNGLKKSS